MWRYLLFSLAAISLLASDTHPTLAIGSPAPDFSLPGVDGKVHKLSDYVSSRVLAVVFTCNHCPIAQMYEQRIQQLADDYKDKGVAVVAIEPNDPSAIRVDELDSSDTSDTLAEMKIRVAYKHLRYPYLYDGETQSVANAYGPKATPHVFVFDGQRKLRYEGRMDNSYRLELVKTRDARNAIDAILAGNPVRVDHTGVFGCSTKWKYKQQSRLDALRKYEEEPVTLEAAGETELKSLRKNPTHKLLLVDFWAASCGSCVRELPDLLITSRMYRDRDFDFVTVSTNTPNEKNSVLQILQKQHASNRNLLASDTPLAIQAAFGAQWQSGVPYTILISADGTILYKHEGEIDILKLRREILANLPADYAGFQKYWTTN